MTDPVLGGILADAAVRFDASLRRALPENASRLSVWLKRVPLQEDGSAIAALAPRSFPCFAIPSWITPKNRFGEDIEFHRDVALSTLNGYYFIRLVDNVADNDGPAELRKLLPSAAYFLKEFQTPYQKYFGYEHPFWLHFQKYWNEQAEASSSDSFLEDVSWDDFLRLSSRKFSASKVPLAAAAFRCADDSSIEPWCDFVNRLGAFYQMVNDFFDWRRDREYGVNTYVQSEWRRRRRPCESLEMWFAREGFDWGQAVLGELVSEARLSAAALKSEEALDWISRREELLARESHQLAMGVTGMRHVLQFFASRKPPMGKSTSGGSEREAEAALGK